MLKLREGDISLQLQWFLQFVPVIGSRELEGGQRGSWLWGWPVRYTCWSACYGWVVLSWPVSWDKAELYLAKTCRWISSICTSELDKDTRSCITDVSVLTCEKDLISDRELRRFRLRSTLREKGTTQNSGPQKAWIFFRVHYSHKGDAAVKFEALSSACQIVNERLIKCVQPAKKN